MGGQSNQDPPACADLFPALFPLFGLFVPSPNPKPHSPLVHMGYPEAHLPFFDVPDAPSAPIRPKKIVIFALLAIVAAFAGQQLEHLGAAAVTPDIALPWVLPFGVLLCCIAVLPFAARHFWEAHYHHVAIALGAIVACYYLFALKIPAPPVNGGGFFELRAGRSLARSFAEYIPFIFLLGSLFTVSGGILIRVRHKGTPGVNAALLLAGAILANAFGTTGAAMLLIRPYLRINKGHLRPYHMVFFIFLVANVGGCLTPIGDPPLFLGYLKGVPFWWVLEKCWPMWVVAVGLLLIIFLLLDRRAQRDEKRADHDGEDGDPGISIFGAFNLLLVFAILAGILLHEPFNVWWGSLHVPHVEQLPLRELVMTATIALSLWKTPRRIHVENVFNFAPIREVALLFIGIFATMVPALNYLSFHAHDPALEAALRTPGQYYFTSGGLSAMLDNAPTYLTFLETEVGKLDQDRIAFITEIVADPARKHPTDADFARYVAAHAGELVTGESVRQFEKEMNGVCDALIKYRDGHGGMLKPEQIQVAFLLGRPALERVLLAISLGAVFFGAMTYIGNGPNFMVKSIAENAGARCPSFFGYFFGYALPLRLPILILVWMLFLRS